MKTILQLQEQDFRDAGNYTDKALSYIKECEELIVDNIMTIRTNISFDLNVPEVQVLNNYLQKLRLSNTIAVQIILE